jgi:hypothetical protein
MWSPCWERWAEAVPSRPARRAPIAPTTAPAAQVQQQRRVLLVASGSLRLLRRAGLGVAPDRTRKHHQSKWRLSHTDRSHHRASPARASAASPMTRDGCHIASETRFWLPSAGIGMRKASPPATLYTVSKGGLEPPRPCGHQPLKLARLPIPPLRRGANKVARNTESPTTRQHG